MTDTTPVGWAGTKRRRPAIERLLARKPLDESAVDRFLARHQVPVVEGARCTFLYRGAADEVFVIHRIVGLPQRVPMQRVGETSLWFAVLELPAGSRVEYQLEVRRGSDVVSGNDPLNPRVAHSPVGSSSVCAASGYVVPPWVTPDPEARPGSLEELVLPSRALRRDARCQVYLPARFRRTHSYPLLVVHDGSDYLQYAAMKTVLDNLIHRLDMAETVVVFTDPGSREVEYPNNAAHARFVVSDLLPALASSLPLLDRPSARCLTGASFGGVASLSVAYRNPGVFGSLLLQSGSFVFTDIGFDHGGGQVFDPVVKFMNRFRARPRRVADRIYQSCGVYEPLIVPNRSMVPVFEGAGMEVRYVEARDGHSWENWRDRLRDGLSWIFPGPQKYYYE
ncbi:alpha/beta hydrolase-fold protein [Luteipulveratus flavus]|uniref:Alpha/beta hydrolase-fold protein n=1 Tax=Luteipulveratus flavus TaxID=3031728 RepID=A0ABT6C522_9MICO|nr:alpha/beta hydrolase-fold protein [Luteipulveratus sp. YIM 133296]MDF8263933.1 alpha/beta hydrolase-fold protein [Luteipulveratus sp. YIM 133296]